MVLSVMRGFDDAQKQIDEAARCRDVLATVDLLRRELTRSYLIALKKSSNESDAALLLQSSDAKQRWEAGFERLKNLTREHRIERKLVKEVRENERFARKLLTVYERLPPGFTSYGMTSMNSSGAGTRYLDSIKTPVFKFIALEGRQAESIPSRVRTMRSQIFRLMGLGGLLAVGTALFLVHWLGSDMSRRLDYVFANARRLMTKEELKQPCSGKDEIADLDEVFYSSANTLQENETFRQGLVGVVSHELRTPLSSLGATLSVLSAGTHGAVSRKSSDALNSAAKTSTTLMSMINNLLDHERIETNKFQPASNSVDAVETLDSSWNFVYDAAEAKSLSFRNSDTKLLLTGDSVQLQRLFEEIFCAVVEKSSSGSRVQANVIENGFSITFDGSAIPTQEAKDLEAPDEEKIADGLRWSVCQSLSRMNGLKLSFESSGNLQTISFKTDEAMPPRAEDQLPEELMQPPRGDLLFKRKWLMLALPVVLSQIVFTSTITFLVYRIEQELLAQHRSWSIMAQANRLTHAISSAGMSVMLYTATGDRLLQARFQESKRKSGEELAAFAKMFDSAHAEKRTAFDTTKKSINNFFEIAERVISTEHDSTVEEMLDEKQGARLNEAVQGYVVPIDILTAEEVASQKKSNEAVKHLRGQIDLINYAMIGFAVVSGLGLIVFLHSNVTKRLGYLMSNSVALSFRTGLTPPLPGDDEFSKLDKILHYVDCKLSEFESFKLRIVGVMRNRLSSSLQQISDNIDELCADSDLSEAARNRANSISADCGRLMRLVNDLMSAQTMEAGKFGLELTMTSTEEIVDVAILSVDQLAQRKRIVIDRPEKSCTIHCDRDRVTQVLINLLSNAIKFSPQSSTIRIALEEDDEWLEFSVEDNGRGIPADQIESLFHRFSQAEKTDWKECGGSGLGLYICKTIVTEHGGEIGLESEIEKGTTFWFSIPKTH